MEPAAISTIRDPIALPFFNEQSFYIREERYLRFLQA